MSRSSKFGSSSFSFGPSVDSASSSFGTYVGPASPFSGFTFGGSFKRKRSTAEDVTAEVTKKARFANGSNIELLTNLSGTRYIDTDIILKVGSKIITGHKCIVRSNSNVLGELLTQSKDKTVEIKEWDPLIIESMIDFMYGLALECSHCDLVELVRCADHFEFKSLRKTYEETLKNLSTKEFLTAIAEWKKKYPSGSASPVVARLMKEFDFQAGTMSELLECTADASLLTDSQARQILMDRCRGPLFNCTYKVGAPFPYTVNGERLEGKVIGLRCHGSSSFGERHTVDYKDSKGVEKCMMVSIPECTFCST